MQNKPRRDNPYQPFCFDVVPQLQPSPRDRRALPLVVVHALYVRYKMGLLDNPYRQTATDAEDLAYPPNGGRGKLIALGIVLPIGVLIYATHIWITKEAFWPGGRGSSGMTVTGDSARAMSVGYAFLSSFSHFRWFWGLVPHYLTFRIGTTISLLGFLAGLCCSFYFLFQ